MTSSCPDRSSLLALAEGRLPSDETRVVEEHVAGCADCRREFDGMASMLRLLEAARHECGGAQEEPPCAAADPAAAQGRWDPWDYVDGTMDGATRRAFERHVASCRSCLRELSDVLAIIGDEINAPDVAASEVALARLRSDARGLAIRIADGAIRFLDGCISGVRDLTVATGDALRDPALLGARVGAEPLTFSWSVDGGYDFVCELSAPGGAPELLGRVERAGRPAADLSVMLRGAGVQRGPESLDDEGRFGPWPLEPGSTELRFDARALPGGTLRVTLSIDQDPMAP